MAFRLIVNMHMMAVRQGWSDDCVILSATNYTEEATRKHPLRLNRVVTLLEDDADRHERLFCQLWQQLTNVTVCSMNVDCVRFKNRFDESVLDVFELMYQTTANCGHDLQDDGEVYDVTTCQSWTQFINMLRCSILLWQHHCC